MKITEISGPILDALRDNKFVGEFTVTISHPRMKEDIEITGYKSNAASFPYDFNQVMQSRINEICFRIVRGDFTNEDFTFAINGRIEYEYTPEE